MRGGPGWTEDWTGVQRVKPRGRAVPLPIRFSSDTKVEALKRSPLFEGLNRKQLRQLAQLSDDLSVPAGTVLCREGSRGREFFVILDGEAAVTRAGRTVATLGPGEFFGEVALIERVERTATVQAASPLRFFVISDQAFGELLAADPGVERKILGALVKRLASTLGDPTTS